MGLFDRFRAQPKWKHADAAIRLAGVEEISLEEQGLLATLAREDADARVRRAAVRKVYDPAILKDLAARDQDPEVREEAGTVLLDLAIGAFEDSNEAESLRALEHLDDQRLLGTVAKSASAEAVSLAALSRLTDPKILGSVARRADHASTRLEALARVDDAEELFAIAMRSEHRDVALAAVERVTNLEHVRTLATRATQKPVARRARAMLRGIEEAEQAAQAAARASQAAPTPDWDAQRDRATRAIDEAAADRDWRAIERRVAVAQAEWERIEREAHESADEARALRYADARRRADEAAARLRQEEAERAERVEQSVRQHAERVAICERVEAVAALLARRAAGDEAAVTIEEATAQVAAARQEWASMTTPLIAADETERLERRFERACSAGQREAERAKANEGRRGRLAELVEQAEGVARQDAAPAGSQRVPWPAIRQEWIDLGGARVAGEALAARFDAAQTSIAAREAAARDQEQQRQREALQRVQQSCERLDAVARAETLTLKDGEAALRDVKAALDALGSVPRPQRTEIAERLKGIQASLFPRVQELREADEWMRWANVGIQEDLCRQAEALREIGDAAEAARKLRDLQQQWKRAAAVPRDRAQELWERFKKAGDEVHARAETHFAQEAAERATSLERKEALCQQAEALAESSDWIKTAEAIKHLQMQWKEIGPVPRGHEKAVWERFRAACDRFFTRRREDLTRRKEEWAANLARKEALIAQAEGIAETQDWNRGIDEIKRLQAEWKAVGPVRKSRSEDVWQRFRAACDRFFERYQQRDQIQVAANVAERDGICREMENLVPAAPAPTEAAPALEALSVQSAGAAEPAAGDATIADAAQPGAESSAPLSPAVASPETTAPVPPTPPEGLAERVAALRHRWQQAPTLMPRDVLAQLHARYSVALAAVVKAFPETFRGSDLDTDANRRKAEELCARVEKQWPAEPERQPQAPPDDSPATILAARLREALAANTIGGGAVAVTENDAKWKAAVAIVKDAQAAWAALGPVPAELANRFDRACRRVLEAAEKRKR